MEFENITEVGNDAYNNTRNGRKDYPVVADSEETEINQAQLIFQGFNNQDILLGRQRVIFDNARFIGNEDYRQNERTFDSALWRYRGWHNTALTLGYLQNENRVYGDSHPTLSDTRMNGLVAHGTLAHTRAGDLSLFGYFFDLKDKPDQSHRNLGFRLAGKVKANENLSFVHEISFADQSSYKDGSDIIDAQYGLLSWGPTWKRFYLTLNYEVLGGDGTYGFATPFASHNSFNGAADKFTSTPAAGLRDSFVRLAYKAKYWQIYLTNHKFESDEGNDDYGEETDLVLSAKLNKYLKLGLKLVDYQADSVSKDTRKLAVYSKFLWK